MCIRDRKNKNAAARIFSDGSFKLTYLRIVTLMSFIKPDRSWKV